MADLEYDGLLVYEEEDQASTLDEDDIIEEPSDDPTVPDINNSDGSGGDPSAEEDIEFADEVEPDSYDEESTEDEDNIIEETADTGDDEDIEPLFTNDDELDTIGSVSEDDEVMVVIVDGEPVVVGTTGSGDALNGRVDYLEVNSLTADSAIIGDLQADTAKIHNLTANELSAAVAYIDDLYADNITAQSIIADHASIATIEANYVTTNYLTANYLTANQITAQYAQINAANIDTATIRDAWVDQLMVNTNLLAKQGQIFTLDAIQVNASNITAGTIDVQRLIITQNGHKYLVQFDNQGNPTYMKLDGDIIEDLTITADKIVAGAITADKITANNLVGTGGWINIANGTFQYGVPSTSEGIAWDGTNLTISADTIKLGGSDIISIIDQHAQNSTIIREYQNGVLVSKVGQDVGALVNADGSFDIVEVTWSGTTPTAGDTKSSFSDETRIGKSDEANLYLTSDTMSFNTEYGEAFKIDSKGSADITYMLKTIAENLYLLTTGSYVTVTDDRLVSGTSAIGAQVTCRVKNATTGYFTDFSFAFGTAKTSRAYGVCECAYDGADTFTITRYSGTSESYVERLQYVSVTAPLAGQPSPTFSLGSRSEDDTAPGAYSLSSGYNNRVEGKHGTALGNNLIMMTDSGTAVGEYNESYKYNRLFAVGDGTSSARHDAFYVDTGGNSNFQRDVRVGTNSAGKGADAKMRIYGTEDTTITDQSNTYHSNLYFYTHTTPFATKKVASRTTDISTTSGTAKAVLNITLEAGMWLVICGVRFEGNYRGVRRANLTTTANDSDINVQIPAYASGGSSAASHTIQLNFTRVCNPTSDTIYYLNAYQNCGSSLAVTGPASTSISQSGTYIYAIRLL